MKGVKIRSIVDYAHSNNMKIGSMRLKDGSSLKVLAKPDGSSVEMYRVKHGKLLGGKGYSGPNTMETAIGEIARIKDLYGANDKYSNCSAEHIFDIFG